MRYTLVGPYLNNSRLPVVQQLNNSRLPLIHHSCIGWLLRLVSCPLPVMLALKAKVSIVDISNTTNIQHDIDPFLYSDCKYRKHDMSSLVQHNVDRLMYCWCHDLDICRQSGYCLHCWFYKVWNDRLYSTYYSFQHFCLFVHIPVVYHHILQCLKTLYAKIWAEWVNGWIDCWPR